MENFSERLTNEIPAFIGAAILSTAILLLTAAMVTRFARRTASAYLLGWTGITAAALLPVVTGFLAFRPGGADFFLRSVGQSGGGILHDCGLSGAVTNLNRLCAEAPTLSLALLFLFEAGILWQGIRFAVGIAASRRQMFSAKPLASPDAHGRLEKCLDRLPGRSFPVLFTSATIRHPSIWCWGLHPAILLPDQMEETLTDGEAQAIFLHELAHLVRRDHLTGLLTRLAGFVLFWNPLFWRLSKRLDTLADAACDLFAVDRGTIPASDYSAMLVRMAADGGHGSVYRFFAQKETIAERVTTILDAGEARGTAAGRVTPSRTAILTAGLIFLPTLTAAILLTFSIMAAETDGRPTGETAAETVIETPAEASGETEAAEKTETPVAETSVVESSVAEPSAEGPTARFLRRRAEKQRDEPVPPERIEAAIRHYQLTLVQIHLGHRNGTVANLAEAEIAWLETAIMNDPPGFSISPSRLQRLLDAAKRLVPARKAEWEAGRADRDAYLAAKAEGARIEMIYRPILEEILAESIRKGWGEIVSYSVSRWARKPARPEMGDFPYHPDQPDEIDLSTPEDACAAYQLWVIGEPDPEKAVENAKILVDFPDDEIRIGAKGASGDRISSDTEAGAETSESVEAFIQSVRRYGGSFAMVTLSRKRVKSDKTIGLEDSDKMNETGENQERFYAEFFSRVDGKWLLDGEFPCDSIDGTDLIFSRLAQRGLVSGQEAANKSADYLFWTKAVQLRLEGVADFHEMAKKYPGESRTALLEKNASAVRPFRTDDVGKNVADFPAVIDRTTPEAACASSWLLTVDNESNPQKAFENAQKLLARGGRGGLSGLQLKDFTRRSDSIRKRADSMIQSVTLYGDDSKVTGDDVKVNGDDGAAGGAEAKNNKADHDGGPRFARVLLRPNDETEKNGRVLSCHLSKIDGQWFIETFWMGSVDMAETVFVNSVGNMAEAGCGSLDEWIQAEERKERGASVPSTESLPSAVESLRSNPNVTVTEIHRPITDRPADAESSSPISQRIDPRRPSGKKPRLAMRIRGTRDHARAD